MSEPKKASKGNDPVTVASIARRKLSTVEIGPDQERIPTGISGLDACLAESDGGPGGLPLGTSVLLSGMPGGGKSTIATVMAAILKGESLYLHGEERETRVKARWNRLQLKDADPWLAPLRQTEDALDHIREVKPMITVVDSIQCLTLDGKRGHQHQLEGAEMLCGQATSTGGSVVLVCHVSKTGQDHAGAAGLSHLVDVWLHVTANAKKGERMLEVRKNRCGRAGFQVPIHIGISSITVGTPAPLSGEGAMSQARTQLEQAIEKAYAMLLDGLKLTAYDADVAGISNPGMWRAGLEMAAKRAGRDGFEVKDEKLKQGGGAPRRTFWIENPPPKGDGALIVGALTSAAVNEAKADGLPSGIVTANPASLIELD